MKEIFMIEHSPYKQVPQGCSDESMSINEDVINKPKEQSSDSWEWPSICTGTISLVKNVYSKTKSYTFDPLANLSCEVVDVMKIVFKQSEDTSKDDALMIEKEIGQVESTIDEIEKKIQFLDSFVTQNKKLYEVAIQEFKKNGQFIAKYPTLSPPDTLILDENIPKDKLCARRLKKLRIEFNLNERIRFIQSNEPLKQCFQEHVVLAQKDGKWFPQNNEHHFLLIKDEDIQDLKDN